MRLSRCYFSKTNARASLDYCVDTVRYLVYCKVMVTHAYLPCRKYDYEHYLCALLVPRGARDAVFAVRALNVETSQVNEDITGILRCRAIGDLKVNSARKLGQKIDNQGLKKI